jgi:glyoxylase-like metal-dependent hydrolase (beta-lactamase superfamily II)
MMQAILEGIYQISGFPKHMINLYLVGETLIDAGIRSDEQRILKAIKGHRVTSHALTHVHPDHQGASHGICAALKIPLYCSESEVEAMESGDLSQQIPANLITKFQAQFWTGAGHPVERDLREGDNLGDFTVIETPGHSPGHLSFWRERDRLLLIGDAARNINFLNLQTELGEPPALFTVDAAQNRQSLRKLAALNPKLILFGHGQPLTDGGKFLDFVNGLPED